MAEVTVEVQCSQENVSTGNTSYNKLMRNLNIAIYIKYCQSLSLPACELAPFD